jgi:hypothetical protein
MQTAIDMAFRSSARLVLLMGLLSLVLFLSWNIFTAFRPWPPLSIPENIDLSVTLNLANNLEEQIKQWQSDLYLETYSVAYNVTDTDSAKPFLTSEANFWFVGWREDWLGQWLKRTNANHVIVRVTVDTEQRKVVDFSYMHGEGFGYDAPLNVRGWSIGEMELLQICDSYDEVNFKEVFQLEIAHVNATVNRPGRAWTVVYANSPQYFECTVNLDTGEIAIRSDESDWMSVDNFLDKQ